MELKPGYKQTKAGIIPEDWEVAELGDLIDYTKGYAFKSSEYTSDGIRIVRVSDTTYDSIREEDPVFVSKNKASKYSKWRLREDDLVISTVGSKPPMYDSMVGKVILIQPRHEGALLNQNAVLIRDKKRRAHFQRILLNHLRTKRYLTRIESIFRGNANQASITLKELFQFAIPFPDADTEQRAIAQALSDVDALIGALDQLIAKKRDVKQAAMQQLLSGQTRLPGFQDEWEVRTICELAAISKGIQLHSSETNPDGDFPHYNGGMSPSSFTDKFNTPENTIAISEGGNSCGYVQLVSRPFWCGGHCYAVVPRSTDNQFLYHALKGRQNAIMGLRVGSGLPNVQKTALAAFKLNVPSENAEQTAIAGVLSDMDAEIATLERRRDKTRDLKQGMMQELLTGRTRLV
jgi:type I restriction enzyme S subunit